MISTINNNNYPSEIKFKNPILLGSGGGGAVFSTNAQYNQNSNLAKKVAIKVSRSRSTKSVKNECEVL
jgi:hypothetical protein